MTAFGSTFQNLMKTHHGNSRKTAKCLFEFRVAAECSQAKENGRTMDDRPRLQGKDILKSTRMNPACTLMQLLSKVFHDFSFAESPFDILGSN
jgi:hypothetical protein